MEPQDRQVATTGKALEVGLTVRRGKRTRIYLALKRPLRDEAGRIIGMVAIAPGHVPRKQCIHPCHGSTRNNRHRAKAQPRKNEIGPRGHTRCAQASTSMSVAY